VKILLPRNRAWATFDLWAVIRQGAASIHRAFPDGERLQLGDASAQGGGPLTPTHASHQIGLDVDVVYYRVNHREQDPLVTTVFQELFVQNGKVTANLDVPRSWAFIKAVHATGRLNRIFMDGAIKRAFCEHARATGELVTAAEALRRLRPWPEHRDHMHVRLDCPLKSPRCQPQEDPPAGDGCDAIDQDMAAARAPGNPEHD
jgi:penicillin-insensitive murein endopeptidase